MELLVGEEKIDEMLLYMFIVVEYIIVACTCNNYVLYKFLRV
jgi:hypothetical protein